MGALPTDLLFPGIVSQDECDRKYCRGFHPDSSVGAKRKMALPSQMNKQHRYRVPAFSSRCIDRDYPSPEKFEPKNYPSAIFQIGSTPGYASCEINLRAGKSFLQKFFQEFPTTDSNLLHALWMKQEF